MQGAVGWPVVCMIVAYPGHTCTHLRLGNGT